MEKSINALLNSNLRVIIPDFGAFIIRQKEPRIIVFNEFLRYNDGLLIEYIARTEGVELDIARQLVLDFAGNVTKVLDGGNIYSLQGLGVLQKDTSGKIVFDSENKSMIPDTTQEIELEPPMIQSEEEKPASKSTPKQSGKSVSGPKKKVTIPVEESTQPVAHEMPVDTVAEIHKQEIDQLETPPEIKAPEESLTSVMQPAGSGKSIEKSIPNQTNLILKWIVLILFANAAIIAWFIFGDNIRGLFREKKAPAGMMDSIFHNLSDSVRVAATDTSLIFRETSEIRTIEENTPAEKNLRYYIVAGCFRDEVNADELVKSLKSKGFNAEKFGKIGNLYAVCFTSFDDKEMAVKELKRIREAIHPEAWMTRF